MNGVAVFRPAKTGLGFLFLAIACPLGLSALTFYVDVKNPTPVSPYTNWVSAATNIQDAVDAAKAGDLVLVTNGVYQSGGRKANGELTNRVAVTKGLTLRSVNGPAVTVIQGSDLPVVPNNTNAVRCIYLTNGTVLCGFTLRNGATQSSASRPDRIGGGAWCEATDTIISNCVIIANSASYVGGGAFQGTFYDCSFISNSAGLNTLGAGGGAYSSTLNNCVLVGNSAGLVGGGVSAGTVKNSLLASNSVSGAAGGGSGGGAYDSSLENCRIVGNISSSVGGGARGGTLSNCTLEGNSAKSSGGGCSAAILNNCLILGNSASAGGGVIAGDANNCVILSNVSPYALSGGADVGTLNNCIVRYNYNAAGNEANYQAYTFSYMNSCCTVPLPTGDGHFSGNITNEPAFADLIGGNLRLQSNSPCINAGANARVASTNDFEGNPRISGGTVDIGAYEYQKPSSVISFAWLSEFGLANDGSADYTDEDNDHMNNWQEWVSGTNPTNATSVLRLLPPVPETSGITVTWLSVSNRVYDVERSADLGATSSFAPLATNIVGAAGATSYTDTNSAAGIRANYRVRARQ